MLIHRTALCTLATALFSFAQTAANPYYVVFLRPNPSRGTLTKAEGERIQSAHMANIRKMGQDGALISAGPFEDTPRTISGLFVFQVESLETARKIAQQDPTVLEHRNTVDVHTWKGPPDIGAEYRRLHTADPKTPENMQVHPLCMIYNGTAWEKEASRRDSLLAEHQRYVSSLRTQGKLGAAGAMGTDDELRELVIFKPLPLEEGQRLMEADPAVKAGVLRVEYHQWWSSDHVLPW